MNSKLIAAMAAVIGMAALMPSADAKPKFFDQVGYNNQIAPGGCYQGPGNGNRGHHKGWYKNGKAYNGGWGNNGYWGNGNNWGNNNNWRGNGNNWGNNGYGYNGYGYNGGNGLLNRIFGNGLNVNGVQSRLDNRIQQGIASGRLSPSEVNRLQSMQNNIDQLESRYRADGNLSINERNRLGSQLNRLSNALNRELHDRNM